MPSPFVAMKELLVVDSNDHHHHHQFILETQNRTMSENTEKNSRPM